MGVSIRYVANAALKAYADKGTAISRATLIALGIPLPKLRGHKTPTHTRKHRGRVATKRDIKWCVKNHESVMDIRL